MEDIGCRQPARASRLEFLLCEWLEIVGKRGGVKGYEQVVDGLGHIAITQISGRRHQSLIDGTTRFDRAVHSEEQQVNQEGPPLWKPDVVSDRIPERRIYSWNPTPGRLMANGAALLKRERCLSARRSSGEQGEKPGHQERPGAQRLT